MKWIKKIFGKKEEEPEVEKHVITEDRNVCDFCGFEIFGEQKTIIKAGKRYHVKPCWRSLQKMAKKQAFG